MSGLLPILFVKFALVIPVVGGQSEVTVNPHYVLGVQPSPCIKPLEQKACADILLANGDKVYVIGSVDEVTGRLASGN